MRTLCQIVLLCSATGCLAGGSLKDEELVDLRSVDPTIVVELRYARKDNIAGRPLYPAGTKCLVRSGVAQRLKLAQHHLRRRGFGLKIWDAYRPPDVQRILFQIAARDRKFVADPDKRALHTWGVAVDATLVDANGREVPMPTSFDRFSPDAHMLYTGSNPVIARNLRILQNAMALAGFHGTPTEWWHFVAKNWREYGPAAVHPSDPASGYPE